MKVIQQFAARRNRRNTKRAVGLGLAAL